MKVDDEKNVVGAAASEPVMRSEIQRAAERQPRARVPFGVARAKMSVIADLPGYFLAWVNDDGGRLDEAQAGGYEFVDRDEIILAPGVTPRNSDSGSKVSMIVGKTKEGGALRAYLMKIRIEWKNETRELLKENRRKRMASIKRGRVGVSGEAELREPSHTSIRISTDKH